MGQREPDSTPNGGSRRRRFAVVFAMPAALVLLLGIGVGTALAADPSAPVLAASSDTGTSQTDGLTNLGTGLTFTGTADPNVTVTLWNGATQIGSATADASGNYTVTTSVAIPANATTSIVAKATRINLLPGGSFEADTEGWWSFAESGPTAATLTRDATVSLSGAASLKAVATSTAGIQVRNAETTAREAAVVVGQTYTWSAYFLSPVTRTIFSRTLYMDATGVSEVGEEQLSSTVVPAVAS